MTGQVNGSMSETPIFKWGNGCPPVMTSCHTSMCIFECNFWMITMIPWLKKYIRYYAHYDWPRGIALQSVCKHTKLKFEERFAFQTPHINIVLFTPNLGSWKMENRYRHAVEKILYLKSIFLFVCQNKNWLYIQNILQLKFSFNQCHKQEFSLFLRKVVFKKQKKRFPMFACSLIENIFCC